MCAFLLPDFFECCVVYCVLKSALSMIDNQQVRTRTRLRVNRLGRMQNSREPFEERAREKKKLEVEMEREGKGERDRRAKQK